MTKRMKKVAAIIAASVLCMSMSVGVFAGSPVDPELPGTEAPATPELPTIDGATATTKDGQKVTIFPNSAAVTEEVKEVIANETAVKDILTQAGYDVVENDNVVVLGLTDLQIEGEIPEGGLDVSIPLSSFNGAQDEVKDLKAGNTLYVLHQKANGEWEVLEGTVVDNEGTLSVSAHFTSLSPVAIIKVMSDGSVAVLDKDEKVVGTIDTTTKADDGNKKSVVTGRTTTSVKKSPKTGN